MVIPVYDVNPVRRTPWMNYALIAANIIVFLLTPTSRTFVVRGDTLAQTCQQEAFYHQYGAIPREMLRNRQLAVVPNGQVGRGPNGPGCVVGRPTYHKDPILSVLFAMFLHGGWLHLLGNMLFLWVFGNNIEDRLGRIRYLVFYLFCGYLAAYGFALASADSSQALIGASGAIAGVLGAYIVLYPRAKVWSLVPFLFFIPLRLSAWIVLGLWFVLQGLYSSGYAVSGGGAVAYLAHVVGFTVGVLIGLVLRETGPQPPRQRRPPHFGPMPRPHPPPSPWDRW
ncbi:MAG TPA: rhomboid family intramembrane serine protease [Mycobacteriales bacterium]|nr:rhomboid family intramembrane serine protease [Mycobacteriales bacterium]